MVSAGVGRRGSVRRVLLLARITGLAIVAGFIIAVGMLGLVIVVVTLGACLSRKRF